LWLNDKLCEHDALCNMSVDVVDESTPSDSLHEDEGEKSQNSKACSSQRRRRNAASDARQKVEEEKGRVCRKDAR